MSNSWNDGFLMSLSNCVPRNSNSAVTLSARLSFRWSRWHFLRPLRGHQWTAQRQRKNTYMLSMVMAHHPTSSTQIMSLHICLVDLTLLRHGSVARPALESAAQLHAVFDAGVP